MVSSLQSFIYVLTLLFLSFVTRINAANNTTSAIYLPAPPGPYVTELKIQVMVDTSRPDPYNSSEKYRKILTSVLTPVLKSECLELCHAQYMPPAVAASYDELTANSAIFARAQLSGICCRAFPLRKHDFPLLIMSPGFGESRLEYSLTAQWLASYGYEVVLVDHPGDSSVVEFPDGEVVIGFTVNEGTIPQRTIVLNIEVQDVLFVIDSYTKGTCGASRAYGRDRKLGALSHEAVASQAMLNDSLNGHPGRIAGGVNYDGRIYGPVLTEGLGSGKKSYLLMEPGEGPVNVTDWDQWWNTTNKLDPGDWQKELRFENSTQATMSELAVVAVAAGLTTNDSPSILNITNIYTVAFFDMVLKGKKEPLLSGPSAAYPGVIFVRSSS